LFCFDITVDLFSWGSGGCGQLATGTTDDAFSPLFAFSTERPRLIAAGGNHVMFVVGDRVLVWGDGKYGQLWCATENGSAALMPVRAALLESAEVALPLRSFAAGWLFSVAVDAEGRVWSCGTYTDAAMAHTVPRSLPCERRVAHVACGMQHALAIADNGALFGWGNNQHGQLGIDRQQSVVGEPQSVPGAIRARAAACGRRHSAIVTLANELVGFGCNRHGQTAFGGTIPTRVQPIASVQCLWDGTVALGAADSDGTFGVHVWGKATFGATLINESSIVRWRALSCGSEHLAAIDGAGALRVFGWNEHGQLGCGDCDASSGADGVVAIARGAVDVVAGGGYVLALIAQDRA
jgi:alpha-tubulin suppressor-like RCC1 family protein